MHFLIKQSHERTHAGQAGIFIAACCSSRRHCLVISPLGLFRLFVSLSVAGLIYIYQTCCHDSPCDCITLGRVSLPRQPVWLYYRMRGDPPYVVFGMMKNGSLIEHWPRHWRKCKKFVNTFNQNDLCTGIMFSVINVISSIFSSLVYSVCFE